MASQSIFAETALHEEYQLGPLVATYQTQTTRAGTLIFWGITLFLLLFVGGGGGFLLWSSFSLLGDPFFSASDLLLSIALPLVMFIVLFFVFFWQFRVHTSLAMPIRRKIVVALYERGFVYREGRKLQVVPWEQLRSVQRLALPRRKEPRRYYKLTVRDEAEITLLIVIAQIGELGAAIESEVVKRELPGVLAAYEAHKPVTFSGFCLNQDGISKSDESLPWLQVEQVSLAQEKLIVKEREVKKDWLSIPAAQVRNMCVLEALLVRIREDQSFRMDNSPVMVRG